VVAFLLDKMLNTDEIIPENEMFNKLIGQMEGSGMKSRLTQYYLKMDPTMRVYYKRLRDSFDYGRYRQGVVYIMPTEEEIKQFAKKEGILKKIIKKVKSIVTGKTNESLQLTKEEFMLIENMLNDVEGDQKEVIGEWEETIQHQNH